MFKMDSLEKRLLSVLLLVAMALVALAVACSSEGLASSSGATAAQRCRRDGPGRTARASRNSGADRHDRQPCVDGTGRRRRRPGC